ncbi:zinc finger BED domain-containing protein RICESLEEPER 2-like [Silene latifolia]|uniref:zinc finger BED domain-containing protein RICESLEEPER 2-like n=1 Tax=Silene latifolia TaxID=37657 RepID=UPI003D77663E
MSESEHMSSDVSAKQLEDLHNALANWVFDAEVPPLSPLALLHKTGPLTPLLDTLDINFNLASVKQDCLRKYNEHREKMKGVLSQNKGLINISVDLVSLESNESRFCVRAHFIDNDWNLIDLILNQTSHRSDDTNVVLEVLKDWGLDGKLLSLTGYPYLANSAKGSLIKEVRNVLLKGNLFQVQCFSDVLSEMVNSSLKMIVGIVDKASPWISPIPVHLSIFTLKEILHFKDSGLFSPENIYGHEEEVPSEYEWAKIKAISEMNDQIYTIFQPLYKVKKPTGNFFLPRLLEFYSYLVQESKSSDEFVKEVVRKMLKTYDMYWDKMYLMLSICAFLDPRYKMKFLEFSAKKFQWAQWDEKVATVYDTIQRLYDSYGVENDRKEYVLGDSDLEEGEDEGGSGMHKDQELGSFMAKLNTIKELKEYTCSQKPLQHDTNPPKKSDLQLYMEEPVLQPKNKNFAVLPWWKDNSLKYPKLSRMARDFLAVRFSIGTWYDVPEDSKVAGLDEELMEALSCTKSWKSAYDFN